MRTTQSRRIVCSFIAFAGMVISGSPALAGMCAPPPPGLFAWYRGEGNALDSADSNQGTLVNNPGFATAKVGLGFSLNGGNDYVALPPNLFPYPTSGAGIAPFSFELWFSTTNGGIILGQQNTIPFTAPSAYVPALYVGTDGMLYAALFWDNYARIVSATVVNDGTFHHAAVTFDGTNEVLYLDGAAIGSQPFTQRAYAASYHYQLGTGFATAGWPATVDGWFSFRGILDEASAYDRALGPAEVAAIFTAGSSGKCPVGVAALLRHRYSFNEAAGSQTITDLVGAAHGALLFAGPTPPFTNGTPDGSTFTGTGLLTLKGTNGYVDLPDGLISSLASASFEVWVDWKGPADSAYQRIFDFGANTHGRDNAGNGTNYLALIPREATGVLSFEETTLYPFGPTVDPNALTLHGPAMPLNQETYIALIYDPLQGVSQLYLNGVLVNSASQPLNALSQFADYNNWLGRSQWAGNPFFNGQYNEFRLWEGTLTPQQVANHFMAGPDRLELPTLLISRAGINVSIGWATNFAAGFQLYSTPSLSPVNWQTVTNPVLTTNGFYRVTFPASGVSAFYRLQQ